MRSALRDAELQPSDITHVNCHATSTTAGDRAEFLALAKLFGPHLPNVWLSATKGSHAHLISASGSLEAIFAVLSAFHGIIPPMPNLSTLDSAIAQNPLMAKFPQGSRALQWTNEKRLVMKNSFGFGGTNASLLFSNYQG